MRMRIGEGLLVAGVVYASACSELPPSPKNQSQGSNASLSTSPPMDKATRFQRYNDGGCAALAADSSGTTRGLPLTRNRLPFTVDPIRHDPKTNQGNGHLIQMHVGGPGQSVVTLSCWVPVTTTAASLAAKLNGSKDPRWRGLFTSLKHARVLPDASQRPPLSPQAQAWEAQMVAPTPSVPAPSAPPNSTHAPSTGSAAFNDGCQDVYSTIEVWQDAAGD